MPEISVTLNADQLDSADELFLFWKELRALGWRGSVVGWDDENGIAQSLIEMHIDDDAALNGTRSLKATVGDWKLLMGSTYSVMSSVDYSAAYGG